MVGISSYNVKQQIPSDIPIDAKYIPSNNLKTQEYIHEINDWTINQKIKINPKKTKIIIFNRSKKFQFTTRIKFQQCSNNR